MTPSETPAGTPPGTPAGNSAGGRDVRLLHVPGGGNSGPDHWHTHWERIDPRCRRVGQSDWTDGTRDDWVATLDRHIGDSIEPTVLVAHSLGTMAVAHWVSDRLGGAGDLGPVVAAMLVAPVDVDSPGLDPASIYARFRPLPMTELPFPSLVVASSDDPWITIERATAVAEAWGSELVDLGPQQHLGSECRLGTWPVGRGLLTRLLHDSAARSGLG